MSTSIPALPLVVRFSIQMLTCCALLTVPAAFAQRNHLPEVVYMPTTKIIEGDQPLLRTYPLSIVSPTNVLVGSSTTVTLNVSLISAPAGVTEANALSFVSLSSTSLTFTGPLQTQTVTVTVSVPEGSFAGEFEYKISTSGWLPGTIDRFAAINMSVIVPEEPQPPVVAITAPLDGSSYITGTPIALSFTATGTAAAPITEIGANASGTPLSVTAVGLNTADASGTSSMTFSLPGVYTIQAYGHNFHGTSSTTVEVTITQAEPPPPSDCSIEWLPPISLGKVQKGGSVIPIKFKLDCDGHAELDTSVTISIYEIFPDNSTSSPVIFAYGAGGPNPPTYAITGKKYHLNFPSARGAHTYHIDIHRLPVGSVTPQLVGTKEFTTR